MRKNINYFVVSKYELPTDMDNITFDENGNIINSKGYIVRPFSEKRDMTKIVNMMNDYLEDINGSVDDIISISEKEIYYIVFYREELENDDDQTEQE